VAVQQVHSRSRHCLEAGCHPASAASDSVGSAVEAWEADATCELSCEAGVVVEEEPVPDCSAGSESLSGTSSTHVLGR